MFAPKVAKAQTKAAESSTNSAHGRSITMAQGPSRGLREQMLFLLRLMEQRGSDVTPETIRAREAPPGISWDFAKIPIFPPNRSSRSETPELAIGRIDDPLEHEADRVADKVMRMPDPGLPIVAPPTQISRKCAACEEEVKQKLQMKPAAVSATKSVEAPAAVHDVLRSPGQPLDATTRAYFEPRFGHDFSRVRVHTDSRAAESARAISARAYSVGSDIVFDAGQFAPDSVAGRHLIAHELTHVLQQDFGVPQLRRQLIPVPDAPPLAGPYSGYQSDPFPTPPPGSALDRSRPSTSKLDLSIEDFKASNSDLGAELLSRIVSGILKVSSKASTPEVAYSFFHFYARWNHTLRQMTPDEEKKENSLGKRLLVTDPGVIFTTTTFQSAVLSYDDVRLADLLLHELAHTEDIAGSVAGEKAYQEGHAYAIEYFYAEINGDMKRTNEIQGLVADGHIFGDVKIVEGQTQFKVTYALMTALREVVTNGSSSHSRSQS